MKVRALINALIEQYAKCGDVEMELMQSEQDVKRNPGTPDGPRYFQIVGPTQIHSLLISEVPK